MWEIEAARLKSELSEAIGAIDNVRRAKEAYQTENRLLRSFLENTKEIVKTCLSNNIDGCFDCPYASSCEVVETDIPTRDVCVLLLKKIEEIERLLRKKEM